jgi:hypothetical protein
MFLLYELLLAGVVAHHPAQETVPLGVMVSLVAAVGAAAVHQILIRRVRAETVVQGSVLLFRTKMLMCKSSLRREHGTSLSGTIRWQRFLWLVLVLVVGRVEGVQRVRRVLLGLVALVVRSPPSQFRSHNLAVQKR